MLQFHFVAALSAATLLSANRTVDDAAVPPAVVEWITASKASAPKLPDFVAQAIAVKDARVLIVGRAFEGTTELAEFERTVSTAAKGCDLIAVDIGFSEGEAVDRWLHYVEDDPRVGQLEQIVANCGAFGWSPSAAQSLLTSLRERDTKPTFVGLGVGAPKIACEEVIAFVKRAYPEGAPRAERVLASLRAEGRNGLPRYYQLDDNERSILRYGLEELIGVLRDQEEALAAASSSPQFARCMRLLASLQQYERTMRFERDGGESDPRGRILCENALAALSSKGTSARLVAFVHVRDLARASDADSFAARLLTDGKIRPTCIATACGDVVFRAIDPNQHGAGLARMPRDLALAVASATSLEAVLSKSGGAFVLDLRTPPRDTTVVEWLKKNQTLRSARTTCGGASETPWSYSIAQDFDGLAWFPRVAKSAP